MSDRVRVAELPPCDVCTSDGIKPPQTARYDGKTTMGPWAYMCPDHFSRWGIGLGTGRGQLLYTSDELEPGNQG